MKEKLSKVYKYNIFVMKLILEASFQKSGNKFVVFLFILYFLGGQFS